MKHECLYGLEERRGSDSGQPRPVDGSVLEEAKARLEHFFQQYNVEPTLFQPELSAPLEFEQSVLPLAAGT